MYGLVNKALEDMIVAEHGDETWQAIKERAGIEVDIFLSHEAYPDELTYSIAGAASEVLDAPVPALLEQFGIYWVLETATAGYGHLLDSAGDNLPDFLQNLHALHVPVSTIFPELEPPVFRCSEVTTNSLRLHYHSKRRGLAAFVVGLVKGLGKRFATPVRVTHDVVRDDGHDHDQFILEWDEPATA